MVHESWGSPFMLETQLKHRLLVSWYVTKREAVNEDGNQSIQQSFKVSKFYIVGSVLFTFNNRKYFLKGNNPSSEFN